MKNMLIVEIDNPKQDIRCCSGYQLPMTIKFKTWNIHCKWLRYLVFEWLFSFVLMVKRYKYRSRIGVSLRVPFFLYCHTNHCFLKRIFKEFSLLFLGKFRNKWWILNNEEWCKDAQNKGRVLFKEPLEDHAASSQL